MVAPLLVALLGVTSMPARSAILQRKGLQPPPPLPVRGRGRPAPLPSQPQPSTASPVPARSPASSSTASSLSGVDILASPNVFRGLSAGTSWSKLEPPEPLTREEELELVRRALFFIATTNAERALAERADHVYRVFNHEVILDEMRREREARLRKGAARSKAAAASAAAAGPVEDALPGCDASDGCPTFAEMSDTEFRLQIALGRSAYNKLFHHHQRLVYYEVNKVWPNWQRATVMEKADFLQEGAQGLLRAIRLFDTTRGVRFSTYAAWHVRAFVMRALRDKSHIVRLPQTLQHDMAQIRKARYRYAVETQGHAPTDAALAEMLHWPPSRVAAALKGLASAVATSLDAEVVSATGTGHLQEPMMSRVASPKHDSAVTENELYGRQLATTLKEAMAERDPQRIQITRLKYGLEDGVEWTYPQLAARFNQTANVVKGIVRTEVNFLRRAKREVLQDFANHML